jgi:putative hemolysin
LIQYYHLRKNKVHKFKPKIEVHYEKGPYIIKTASNVEELVQALKLRYLIFRKEFLDQENSRMSLKRIDIDHFDFLADHLIIIEKNSGQVVGTYRLISSLFSQQFYSEREFNLRRLLERPGNKLELGRACIHKEYRNGSIISLLWRGIMQYILKTNTNLLFGCACIKTASPRQAALLYKFFMLKEKYKEEFFCPPTVAYSLPQLDLWINFLKRDLSPDELTEAEQLIPPLCQAYLSAGAFLGGEPAYDSEFKCIDFLTILEVDNLNSNLWKRYQESPTSYLTTERLSAS